MFKPPEPAEGEEGEGAGGEEGEEGSEEKKPKEPEEVFPQHVFVQEVVREPQMHFFKVPKLGSYLAVALEYDSCLAEGALDKAYEDFKQCKIDEEE